jgi:hypothetical protein
MTDRVIPNKKKVRLSTGVVVSVPDSFELSKSDEGVILEAIGYVEMLTRKRVHSVHINKDHEDEGRLYGMNFVFDRNQEL